ncbi:sugar dehydrogenase complex small subunit [Frateuria aurantia]
MIDQSRRRLLIGSGSVAGLAVAGTLGWRQQHSPAPLPLPAPATELPVASPGFLKLSAQLTGRERPDPLLGQRLYQDLVMRFRDLEQHIDVIAQRLSAAAGQPPDLSDQPVSRDIYQQMLSGWYLGVVGTHLAPRCIGFENTVSYEVVASWVSPPSYCAGEPFFWVNKPTQVH